MSPVFFKSRAGLSRGCFFLNLTETLWSLDSLLSPGLTCSKANEIKKVVMIERATWDGEPRPRGRQNCIWPVGVSPSADELALLLCRKSRWTGSDPVFCVAERTCNFPSLGLIGLDPTAPFLSHSIMTGLGPTQQLTQRGWVGQPSRRGAILESGDSVGLELNIFSYWLKHYIFAWKHGGITNTV